GERATGWASADAPPSCESAAALARLQRSWAQVTHPGKSGQRSKDSADAERKAKGKRQKAKGKRRKAKGEGKRQKAKGERQKAKGKRRRQKAKGKRRKAKGERLKVLTFAFLLLPFPDKCYPVDVNLWRFGFVVLAIGLFFFARVSLGEEAKPIRLRNQ